ncbi:MAG: (Fe-S)-binding protein [Deltaproteobacteria bacterium]|nr:(Fe-S)-binding protein [Deltaproteobacteria bacterium]
MFADSPLVVAPSGSCVHMVREKYGDLLEGRDLADWEDLRTRIHELTDFLTGVRGIKAWGGSYKASAVLHWSCHLPQKEHVQAGVERLLGSIPGLDLLPRPDFECCGFGGSFWALWREVSAAIGRRRIHVLSKDDPDTLLLAEPGCLLQMRLSVKESGRDIRVRHVAEVLAEALT